LYARTRTAASSRSSASRKTCPHSRGKDGKHIAVGVHVVDAGLDVPAALPHLLVRGRIHAELVARTSGNGIQPDVGELATVVDPDVVADLGAHDPWDVVATAKGCGEVLLEHVGRFHDMVVDTHQDQVIDMHHAIIGKSVPTSQWHRRRAAGRPLKK
jgi:hypothetical protein